MSPRRTEPDGEAEIVDPAPADHDATKATESRLLDAAESVFAEHGFHAATTAAIAERAGVNKTLIHYYFRSKEGLYRAVMERISSQHAVFLEDFALRDPAEALSAATDRYVRMLAANPNYVRLCAYCALEGTEVHADHELYERLSNAAIGALRRGMDAGVFRREDPRHVLASVEGMCRFFFEHEESMRKQWGNDFERERIVAERCEHIVRLLLNGLLQSPLQPQQVTKRVRGGNASAQD